MSVKEIVKNAFRKRPEVERVEPDIESDSFSSQEAKEIVDIVLDDVDAATTMMAEWLEMRKRDIQMYEGERPSIIENLSKESWQSDRNLGLCASVCDTYQAVLLSTCYNPDTIHFVAGQDNDVDRRENMAKFTKWMSGEQECNLNPVFDDYIHNKITQGVGCMKVYWKVWNEWVDLRIPQYNNEGDFTGYEIKTENKRFEKGVIENIANLEDILVPTYGATLQEKKFLIHVIHKTADEILDASNKEIYKGIDKNFTKKLARAVFDYRLKKIGKEKAEQLGLLTEDSLTYSDYRNCPTDLLEWYGTLTIKNKTEKFRAVVEPSTKTLLSLKPLRKITRSGKIPFVGGAFVRRPGFWQGKSLPWLVAPIVNAFNNVFNQKSDFQYTQNVPFGFFKPSEEFKKQTYRIKPGDLYPSDTPNDIVFPNLTRSMAWAESDYRILLECLEKVTGAASYFLSTQRNASGTATRDMIVNQKSETRFGLWVDRTIQEICEAITMLLQYYQDWAPNTLGERVIGEDGRKLFQQFSLESIRGQYDVRLTPDFITGSKQMERQLALWGVEFLSNTIWFNPQVNPKGNWQLTRDAAVKMGIENIENLMPPKPEVNVEDSDLVKEKWSMIAQGEMPELNEGENAIMLVQGLTAMKEKKYNELDEEYRPNLDAYLFRLQVQALDQMKKQMQQVEAEKLAMSMVMYDRARQGGMIDEQTNAAVPPAGIPSRESGMGGVGPVGGMAGAEAIPSAQGGALPVGGQPGVGAQGV